MKWSVEAVGLWQGSPQRRRGLQEGYYVLCKDMGSGGQTCASGFLLRVVNLLVHTPLLDRAVRLKVHWTARIGQASPAGLQRLLGAQLTSAHLICPAVSTGMQKMLPVETHGTSLR